LGTCGRVSHPTPPARRKPGQEHAEVVRPLQGLLPGGETGKNIPGEALRGSRGIG